LGVTSRYICFS